LEKIKEKFKKAGGTFLFYDANTIKKSSDKPFRPIVITPSEKKLEEKNRNWQILKYIEIILRSQ
jgi:hypothetical protein